ncbi:MAG: 5'/3'-nucleotidase SurE [Eisenbergiella massiliensis]
MAYSVAGTPADCVKVGIRHLMQDRPDVVFSGINCGYNVGVDILYSGTVGAAMEALLNGIPAIAFSEERGGTSEVADACLLSVAEKLLEAGCAPDEIWNVNFPGCPLRELRGIRENRIPEKTQFYMDNYLVEEGPEGGCSFRLRDPVQAAARTDMEAVLERYISIGKIRNTVLGAKGRTDEPENALF